MACWACSAAGLLMDADDLSGARGVQGADFVLGFDALATDDQVVFAAQLTEDKLQCCLHLASVFQRLEIGEGLIGKLSLRRRRLNGSGDIFRCHSQSIVADNAA